jgi:hypothetical protein
MKDGAGFRKKIYYPKTDLVFRFGENQILVAVILAQFSIGFYPKTIIVYTRILVLKP